MNFNCERFSRYDSRTGVYNIIAKNEVEAILQFYNYFNEHKTEYAPVNIVTKTTQEEILALVKPMFSDMPNDFIDFVATIYSQHPSTTEEVTIEIDGVTITANIGCRYNEHPDSKREKVIDAVLKAIEKENKEALDEYEKRNE